LLAALKGDFPVSQCSAIILILEVTNGSVHDLDAAQKVTSTTWSGKPDVYHAFSACIFPILPLGASLIGSAKKL
jgi:hypothetical protein